jgi:tetratricopeptide (TPR) repeat protein
MIVCPACQAENPDGTKICVKCATELPKVGAKPKTVEAGAKGLEFKDLRRDMVDILWVLLILFLIGLGFYASASKGTWKFTEVDEAKVVEAPVVVQKAAPAPSRHVTSSKRRDAVVEAEPIPLGEEPVVFGNPEKFYQTGKDQFDTKKYNASFNSLRKALEIDPTFAKAYFALGYLYHRFEMDDAAVKMYEMTLRFDPSHAEAINNLAMRYNDAGNADDALDLLQKAVAIDSRNADFQYNLGSLYWDKGRVPEALRAYQTAATLRPSDVIIMNDLALTYEKLGMKQEALDSWQKVLQFAESPEMLQQAQTHIFFLQSQS